jgi:imidazolonepropionase
VAVALASDCNPGTSYTTSLPFVVALACQELDMTPREALRAVTLGARPPCAATTSGTCGSARAATSWC